ncbi:uncharacterized protein LOC127452299 [Myxocyprinus asiaticus]|uniref:uncharacterized protein LOC127452299 n=1 Tax=Myxocyprinus asiaticus TaxID=70543 RepID=UPI002223D9C7|nr:uncharacterized protein LOC127452299 [Myxocyprinus asiaticus]XP_051573642.1 uncharacterized protein LOC127452299 [Myxocyprinus asiaticus]
MDPPNQVSVMHLQDSHSSALDLSVGCRQSPLKTNNMEALNLVRKPNWFGITSGNKAVNMSDSRSGRYITQPCQPNPPAHPEPASKHYGTRACGMSSHGPYSVPLPQINGLPSVAQILSQCPPAGRLFDDDYHVEIDDVLRRTKKHKADSLLENRILGDRIAHNGFETLSKETYLSDSLSVMSQTEGSACLHQDANAAAYTLCSTSSAAEQTVVETLASGCTEANETSPRSDEYISSDNESDIVEVPITNSKCKTPPHCRSQSRSVIVHEISNEAGSSSSARQEVDWDSQMGPSPENVNNFHVLDEPSFEAHDVSNDSKSKSLLSWMESVSIPLLPQDSDQDTNSAFPKIFPSTSDADNTSALKSRPSGTLCLMPSHPQKTPASKSRKRTKPRAKTRTPRKRVRASPRSKSKASTTKRRRRKPWPSRAGSSMFSPPEPEINLRYANHKDDKKDVKSDSFAPYIHMELSSCTIMNFKEEDDVVMKKGSQHQTVSGVIPKTSCLLLGRVGSNARFQVKHLCCLCGRTANGEGLGDLHGPYHPSRAQPVCKSDNSPPAQRQDCSDLDSVYSLEDVGSQSIKEADRFEIGAKRQRKENCVERVEESGVCSERWIHEDCSIWTGGVFLVKGRLYGLEEAIRLAQETVCSYCHRVGATLGCFFKDCPNKYHFPCALQSDSSLNEENFTIRCPKHKNKASRMSVSRLKNR